MGYVEEAIKSILDGASGLTALVGTRIYPNRIPQETAMPAVDYQRISGPRLHAMGGGPGLTYPRFQVNSWSDDYLESKNVAEEVRLALQDYTGTIASTVIQWIIFEDDHDIPDPQGIKFHVASDFTIWAEE